MGSHSHPLEGGKDKGWMVGAQVCHDSRFNKMIKYMSLSNGNSNQIRICVSSKFFLKGFIFLNSRIPVDEAYIKVITF